jgi:hypothetical protein
MPTYLDVPAGFLVEGDAGDYILELQKTLYGLRQAGLNWFETLKQHLLSIGFKQSSIDQCCFIWDSLVLLCYVDDCLLFCSDNNKKAFPLYEDVTADASHSSSNQERSQSTAFFFLPAVRKVNILRCHGSDYSLMK